jgi:hypothetical protein
MGEIAIMEFTFLESFLLAFSPLFGIVLVGLTSDWIKGE